MSYSLTTDQVRIEFALDHKPGKDILSSGPPKLYKGANWIIDIAVIQNKVAVDISTWYELFIDIFPLNTFVEEDIVLSSSQTTGFGTTMTYNEWLAGSAQQGRFEWPGDDTHLNLGGALTKDFTVRVRGTTTVATGSKEFVVGLATLTVVEAGIPVPVA